ncbi:hypothetical protein [Paracoccus sp. KR1-242]|uniref:hypothetical protein n=1 Tax=Paracoccus sp. KR1-242 TaxID=3410028 RepID=UPI003C0547ED
MAENLSRSGGDASFDAASFKKHIKSVNAAKAKATEFNGEAGALTKEFVEKRNYDKSAFTFISRLARKETADAQATVAAVVTYAHAMGFFDSSDMFQDHTKAMREILDKIDAGKAGSGAATVRKLAKAQEEAGATAH